MRLRYFNTIRRKIESALHVFLHGGFMQVIAYFVPILCIFAILDVQPSNRMYNVCVMIIHRLFDEVLYTIESVSDLWWKIDGL